MKNLLIALGLAIATALLIGFSISEKHTAKEDYANFSEGDIIQIRSLIFKAGTMFDKNYPVIAGYLKSQMKFQWGSYWNVAVFNRPDYNSKFYLTGTYGDTYRNKRYFMAQDVQRFGWSILILETNNTQISNNFFILQENQVKVPQLIVPERMNPNEETHLEDLKHLTYTKNKSVDVDSAQEAGIDLAITTAYTWNKNIIDFTNVLRGLIQTNLNQHWEVCTSYEGTPGFAFMYTSPYEQWIEYGGYGLVNKWHVYIWRNVRTG